MPQPPQWEMFVFKFTQAPLQSVVLAGQADAHAPELHTCPAGHTCPHAPQFETSLDKSTHAPLHAVSALEQPQIPPTQLCPGGQAWPQAPQSASLLNRSTHAP